LLNGGLYGFVLLQFYHNAVRHIEILVFTDILDAIDNVARHAFGFSSGRDGYI